MSSGVPINVYDFDYTIYDGDASLDFILYCTLRNPRTWKRLPAQGIAIIKFVLGRSSRRQLKEAAFAFLRDTKDLDALLQKFWDTHERKMKDWYLNQKQPSDIIISASPEFLLAPIAQKLGVQPPIATIMDTRTGTITGENNRAEEKVIRLQKQHPSVIIGSMYSDSMSDTPLLRLADKAYIVKKHQMRIIPNDQLD